MKSRFSLLCFGIALSIVSHLHGDERFAHQDVTFKADCDGTSQRYVLMHRREFDPAETHHLLIALHGHGSDRWQFFDSNYPTGKVSRDLAFQRDFLLILPDYRAKTSWMGPKAEADLCQIIAEVKTRFRIGKVFLCGGSMGGSSALSFAALRPELVDAVAAMNGTANHLEYERFQDAIRESFGGTKTEVPEEYKKRSAEYWPLRFTMPVGITASGKDTVVPPDSVVRLAGILKKLDRRVLLVFREEMGHTSQPEDVRRVLDFVVDQALQQKIAQE